MTNSFLHDWFISLNLECYKNKSILIIGSGYIANEYCKVFKFLDHGDVTIIGNSEESTKKLADEFKFKYFTGGFENQLDKIEQKDLVIICTPIHLLLQATKQALLSGQTNILIEKPGSLYPDDLLKINEMISNQTVRIAFNRLFYPSLFKLKKLLSNETITSCHFRFIEWIDTINFQKYQKDAYVRWGISNSLHVIGMAFDIIDVPLKISCFQGGSLDWHPSGSIFTGNGVSKKNIPFSYHSDWESSGRWSIEIFTKKNIYRLMPLEELHAYNNQSHTWEKIETKSYFSKLKPGLGEQIIMMLCDDHSIKNHLMSLSETANLIKIAEKIFAYE